MQAIIKKYQQSALFYLLISTLIMIAGIICGYLWSSDIGKWIYDKNFSNTIGLSEVLSFIGVLIAAITYRLALKAYREWKRPFKLEKMFELSSFLETLSARCLKIMFELKNIKNLSSEDFPENKKLIIIMIIEYEILIMKGLSYAPIFEKK